MNKNLVTTVTATIVALATLFVVFFMGVGYGKLATKRGVVEIIEEAEVCNNLGVWQELKEVDDQVIILSAEALEISADSFFAMADYDLARVEMNTAKVQKLAGPLQKAKDKRLEILKALGY